MPGCPGYCKGLPEALHSNLEKKNTPQQITQERLLATVVYSMFLLVFSDMKLISSPFHNLYIKKEKKKKTPQYFLLF